MEFGLIGEHLGHSYSPEIHAAFAPYRYELRELAPEELEDFFRAREFRGINVTIPYKQAVIPLLDEVDDAARRIGAVNTVVNRGGKLLGYNTDYSGMRALLEYRHIDLAGKKVLILGTGGTSKTAHAAAEDLGAAQILHVSRTGKDGALTYAAAKREHRDAQVILNTTPVGMYPDTEGEPIDLSAFPALSGAADVIYNPLRTNFVLDALDRGIPAAGGLYMLAAQAVCASALFLGKEAEPEQIEDAYRAVVRQKRAIALIGMPTSGKTSVGRLLAARTGKKLIDTDAEIVRRIGMPIPVFFRQRGEAAFRVIEHEITAWASEQEGVVIATGGGAVLNDDNVRTLRRSGVTVFLDRPLEKLLASADRPLSGTREDLELRYRERYDRYRAAADFTVDGGGSIEETARRVTEVLEQL